MLDSRRKSHSLLVGFGRIQPVWPFEDTTAGLWGDFTAMVATVRSTPHHTPIHRKRAKKKNTDTHTKFPSNPCV